MLKKTLTLLLVWYLCAGFILAFEHTKVYGRCDMSPISLVNPVYMVTCHLLKEVGDNND